MLRNKNGKQIMYVYMIGLRTFTFAKQLRTFVSQRLLLEALRPETSTEIIKKFERRRRLLSEKQWTDKKSLQDLYRYIIIIILWLFICYHKEMPNKNSQSYYYLLFILFKSIDILCGTTTIRWLNMNSPARNM